MPGYPVHSIFWANNHLHFSTIAPKVRNFFRRAADNLNASNACLEVEVMARKKHDGLFKELIGIGLTGRDDFAGRQHAIDGDTQHADVFVRPVEVVNDEPRSALLVSMCRERNVIIEVFRQTPRLDEVRDCLCKQLTWHRTHRDKDEGYMMPWLWILSPGKPLGALTQAAAVDDSESWGRGFYALPHLLQSGIVVIAELLERTETLTLRLMGRGEVQKRAIEELLRNHPDMRQDPYVQAFANWRVALEQIPRELWAPVDEEQMMNIQELVQQRDEHLREEGREEGREEELRLSILKLFSTRHGKAPQELRLAVEACDDLTQLREWLMLVATQPRDDVLAQLLG